MWCLEIRNGKVTKFEFDSNAVCAYSLFCGVYEEPPHGTPAGVRFWLRRDGSVEWIRCFGIMICDRGYGSWNEHTGPNVPGKEEEARVLWAKLKELQPKEDGAATRGRMLELD